MKDKIEILVYKAKERDPDAFTSLMDGQIQGMYKIAKSILQNDEDVADAIRNPTLYVTLLTCTIPCDKKPSNCMKISCINTFVSV